MRILNYQLKQLCQNNRDGSYATQVQRERVLTLIANQLYGLGFRQMHAKSLRPKHVEALVREWLDAGIAVGTIKNRMTALRWWAAKVNKENVVARSNAHYGIPCRQYANSTNRAKILEAEKLAKVTDAHVRMSLELQREFGLRRKEAIMIRPHLADKGEILWLKDSWTKGGREREVPIRTEAQRVALEKAKTFVGKSSLIPSHRNYKEQKNLYEGQCIRAGLCKMHGLRHAYAQRRFEELAGFRAPLAGGPRRKELSADERALDKKARAVISTELGHNREQITMTYLGR